MRIPLMRRVEPKYAFGFALLLVLLQQLAGTSVSFSLLSAAYVFCATLAFNTAEGLTRASGAFILTSGVLIVLIGLAYKGVLFEPGESNLLAPDRTLEIHCCSMLMLAGLAWIVRLIRPRKGLLSGMAVGDAMRKGAFASILLGVVLSVIDLMTAAQDGSLLGVVRQINQFVPMGMLLATYHQVQKTSGRSSTNWLVWFGGLFGFATGVIAYSKEGMFTPPLVWLISAVAAGHSFTWKQVGGVVLAMVFAFELLVPFSQAGRAYRDYDDSLSSRMSVAWSLFDDLPSVRRQFLAYEAERANQESDAPHYYNTPQGFFDRLTMLPPDDALTAYTVGGNEEGFGPGLAAYVNIVPHFIWPGKPIYYPGNGYAREIGMIGEEDETTGVSFSPAADAYHEGGWLGLFTIFPLTLGLLFFVIESLSGDLRTSPWGLLFVIRSVHLAPEGLLGGQVYLFTVGAFSVIVVALMSKYVLPPIGGLLLNQERTRVRKTLAFPPGRNDLGLGRQQPDPGSPLT